MHYSQTYVDGYVLNLHRGALCARRRLQRAEYHALTLGALADDKAAVRAILSQHGSGCFAGQGRPQPHG